MPRVKNETTAKSDAAIKAPTEKSSKKSSEKASEKAAKKLAAKESSAKKKEATETEAKDTEAAETPSEIYDVDVTNTVIDEFKETSSSAADDFTKILVAVQDLTTKLSALKNKLRTLEKKHTREMKAATKSNRRAASKAPRTPSGFVKPTKISAELAAFLGKSDSTEMARTEVTKEINAYIRSNGLQNKDNGRIINADTKLKSLLNLSGDDQLTYFNLQRYMSPHFPKVQPVQTA